MAGVQKRLVLDDVVLLDDRFQESMCQDTLTGRKISTTARVSDKRREITLSKKSIPKFSLIQGIINDYKSLDIKGDVGIIDTGTGIFHVKLSTLKLLKAIALNSQSPCLEYAQACFKAYMEIMRQAITGQKPMINPTGEESSEFENHVFAEIMFFYVDECD